MKFTYKNIGLLLFTFLFSSAAGFILAGSSETGYKINDVYQEVEFKKGETGSAIEKMFIKKISGGSVFVGTRKNSELSSLISNPPSGLVAFKQNSFTTTSCGHTCSTWWVGPSQTSDIRKIYIPASGTYRFLMKTQRQSFQGDEDFSMYIDLNKNGSYSDANEYLFRSDDQGEDSNHVSNWRWEWGTTKVDGTGTRISRYLNKGYYNFKMVNKGSDNVGIGYFRIYAYQFNMKKMKNKKYIKYSVLLVLLLVILLGLIFFKDNIVTENIKINNFNNGGLIEGEMYNEGVGYVKKTAEEIMIIEKGIDEDLLSEGYSVDENIPSVVKDEDRGYCFLEDENLWLRLNYYNKDDEIIYLNKYSLEKDIDRRCLGKDKSFFNYLSLMAKGDYINCVEYRETKKNCIYY